MYAHASLDDVEARDIDNLDPRLKAIGFELRPEKMRPSVWEYSPGERNNCHRQGEQEELYVVLSGRFTMRLGDDPDALEEELDLREGDVVVVPPETWRQLESRAESELLVVGAPNVKDDGVLPDGE